MSAINKITKGDTINLLADIDAIIANWKIRCEIYDDSGNCIKLATENTGGSDDQIQITDPANGIFIIKVKKNKTTCFDDRAHIEIEMETDQGEIHTPYQGDINFEKERIDWETP